jgi:hypothetical protein
MYTQRLSAALPHTEDGTDEHDTNNLVTRAELSGWHGKPDNDHKVTRQKKSAHVAQQT